MKRIFRRAILVSAAFAAAVVAVRAPRVNAQDSDVLSPDQSAAKAKQLVQQAVQALGGAAFMNLKDATCTGHMGQFDHSGELTGYEKFVDYVIPPFKDRTENLPQRNQIDVFNDDKGWSLDLGGVSPEPASQLAEFQEDTMKDLNYILRTRINDPNMMVRYDGTDIVDLKKVDWIQLIDSDDRTIRIAFDSASHLPVRKTVHARDPKLRMVTDETEYYSLFYVADGIETPKQVTRERNNMKVLQVFFDSCQYNTGLKDSLFTKESLDERWAQIPNRQKYHDKDKKKGKKDDSDSSDTH